MFDEIKSKLSERTLYEVVKLSEMQIAGHFLGIYVIRSSLNIWITEQKWFARWYWRKRYSFAKLTKALKPKQIKELIKMVYSMEAVEPEDDSKKKVNPTAK